MSNVICVCGVGCVGKSTYCDQLLERYQVERKLRPILLRPGKFFREVFGPDFFVKLDNPGAPAATEHWVRNLAYQAIQAGYDYDRDIILDGFPRTDRQFDWLMLSSLVATKRLGVEIRFLWTTEGALNMRIAKKREDEPDAADLLDVRVLKDAALLSSLHQAVHAVLPPVNKSVISGGSYPNLKVADINV